MPSDGPRSRRDRYRSIVDVYDPDVPPGQPVEGQTGEHYQHPSVELFSAAQRVVEGARTLRPDGTQELVPPLTRHARVLVVLCVGRGCGQGRQGAVLAEVWRVPGYGLLFAARVAKARSTTTFPDLHHDACVMVHPALERERGSGPDQWTTASWTTEVGLTNWSSRGWVRAPAGVQPAERWNPGRYALVRDLLDRDDIQHVPLRVHCHRHGPATLDPTKLLGTILGATRRARVRLDAVYAE